MCNKNSITTNQQVSNDVHDGGKILMTERKVHDPKLEELPRDGNQLVSLKKKNKPGVQKHVYQWVLE